MYMFIFLKNCMPGWRYYGLAAVATTSQLRVHRTLSFQVCDKNRLGGFSDFLKIPKVISREHQKRLLGGVGAIALKKM